MAALNVSGRQILLLIDGCGLFLRIVTDGDLRRLLLNGAEMDDTLSELPEVTPVSAHCAISRKDALELMDLNRIDHLPLIDSEGRAVRVLSRRDIGPQILLSTPHMGDTEIQFIAEAFRTNWIAPLGPNVDGFESDIASFVGVAHAAAMSSGTAAIHLALRLLDVGPGDRVFCSTLTFAASANPIIYQGAEPVFIDAEPDSWNMSPVALEQAFKAAAREGWRPKAVIIVDLYGQSADMDPLMELCNQYGVPIVEDAAESLGATYKGRQSGSFGKIGIFSFNGNKIITTSGGGMLVSDDPDLVQRARFLSTQARDPAPHYEHTEIGYNYRMSNVLAGIGRGQIQVLPDRVEARRAVFDAYAAGLADLPELQWMPEPAWSRGNRWLSAFTLAPELRLSVNDILGGLANELIEARPTWKPMHLQPVFKGARYFNHGNEQVSDFIFERGVCLPSGSNMAAGEIDRIVETLRAVVRRR